MHAAFALQAFVGDAPEIGRYAPHLFPDFGRVLVVKTSGERDAQYVSERAGPVRR